jgi:hypothetical protein
MSAILSPPSSNAPPNRKLTGVDFLAGVCANALQKKDKNKKKIRVDLKIEIIAWF